MNAFRSDLMVWLRAQVREGCTRLTLRRRDDDFFEHHVWEWPLTPTTDFDRLIEDAFGRARRDTSRRNRPTLFAFFSLLPGQAIHHDKLTWRVDP